MAGVALFVDLCPGRSLQVWPTLLVVERIADAVRTRDAAGISNLLFEGTPPMVRSGARSETELWDYKAEVPRTPEDWANAARHALAFHNNRGGVIVFGVRDTDYSYCGASVRLDSKVFNDKVRRYLGDKFWIDFHREAISADQRYLGIAIVPPRGGQLAYFIDDAPEVGGKREFVRGQSAIRVGDSSYVLSAAEARKHQSSLSVNLAGAPYAVDEPFFRLLPLETQHYVKRPALGGAITDALGDPRTSVVSLTGVGGSGKTTLATWATRQAYDAERFGFIVSVTAKDRELAPDGIRSLKASLTTYDTLLNAICDVLGFPEQKREPVEKRAAAVREVLVDSNGLLYVDNLETVDDPRIIRFLDDLPIGVRAIVTSRRAKVRVSVRPIEVGSLSAKEAVELVRSMQDAPGLGYVSDLSNAEIERITQSCDGLPLAVRWTLLRAGSAAEAIRRSENLGNYRAKDESELLEFTFRRVFEDMTEIERSVMRTLSIFQEPSASEVLVAGTGHQGYGVVDALDDLVTDSLAHRLFDSDRNDYVYELAPLTRSFVLQELQAAPGEEARIRQRLTQWFEAVDIKDAGERVIVRELRQGREAPEAALLDLAVAAQRRKDNWTAEDMFRQALDRNPTSWRAARLFAEFERHVNQNTTHALELYEQAASNAPARGHDRALIFREWGMLLRESGSPDATEAAIEKFEVALTETPNDATLVHALASMYDRKGVYRRVIELLEPLRAHQSIKTRRLALLLLLRAYERTMAIVEAAEVRAELRELPA
jgi:tetratricopeptide (TPR) repeat protein